MNARAEAEPGFFIAQRSMIVGAQASIQGVEESWIAPVAVYDAPLGFGEECWLPETTDTVMSFALAGAAVRCEWGRKAGAVITSAHISLQPRGVPNHYRADEQIRFAQFVIPDSLLARVGDDLGSPCRQAGALRPELIAVDDRVLRGWLNQYVARATAARIAPTRVEMEARALLIVNRLLTEHHDVRGRGPSPTGLADWALRRTCEFLRAHLADDVGLTELAAIAGLSPHHFARAFKVSTGYPPHAYQMHLRLEHARRLLQETDHSVGTVAQMVGYAEQGTLTRLFRKSVGMTPSRYRAEIRS